MTTGEIVTTHWPLLGTVIDIRITAHDHSEAIRAEQVVCDEITRLEHVFSIHDDTSMLNRWILDPTTPTSNEFDELLSIALRWQRCSSGAFNVSTRRFWNLWAQAAVDGCRPSVGELHDLAENLHEAPYGFEGHLLCQVGDCSGLDFNAIAKGFIVDLAAEAAWRLCGLDSMSVSAGGDVVHRGPVPIRIGIEDPSTVLDGTPPLVDIDVQNCAVATSGSARRGMSVGAEWISHVLDPRTGQPARDSASVTVRASNATTADVVATIVCTMEPDEGLVFIDMLNSVGRHGHPSEAFEDVVTGPVACWIIDVEGAIHSSER